MSRNSSTSLCERECSASSSKRCNTCPRDKIIPFKVIDEEHVGILDPAIFDMFVSYFHAQRPSSRAVLAGAQGKEISLTEEELQIKFVGNHPLAVLQAKRFLRPSTSSHQPGVVQLADAFEILRRVCKVGTQKSIPFHP